MARTSGRKGRRWRTLRAQVLETCPVCWLCGHPIDRALPWQHPMAAQVDHVVPLSKGGSPEDPANLRAAHRRCNITRGNRMAGPKPPTSRPW